MRNFLTLVIVFTSLITSAQIIVDLPINNVLYRGYSNYIECYGDSFGKSVHLTTEKSDSSLAITKSGKGWIVKTRGQNKTATLCLVTEKNDTILRNVYAIRSLPSPELKWSVKQKDNRFNAVPGDSLFAEIDVAGRYLNYHVDKWSLSASGTSKTFTGSGSKLSNEVIEFINSLPDDSEINISGTCSGKGLAYRAVASTFSKSNFFTKERLLAKTNRFFVVDKTPENAAMFDPSNPSSLIAFGRYAFENLNAKGLTDNLIKQYQLHKLPMTEGKSNSVIMPIYDKNGFEKYKMVYNEEFKDSLPMYLDTTYTITEYADFADITRIIFFEKEEIDTLTGKTNFVWDKIAFAKKIASFDNKYVITACLKQNEHDYLKWVPSPFLLQLDQSESKKLLDAKNKNSLLSMLTKNESFRQSVIEESLEVVAYFSTDPNELIDTLNKVAREPNSTIKFYPVQSNYDSTKVYYVLSFGTGSVKLAFTKEQLISMKNPWFNEIINQYEVGRTKKLSPQINFIMNSLKNTGNNYFYEGDSNEELLNTYYINQYVPLNDYYFGLFFR